MRERSQRSPRGILGSTVWNGPVTRTVADDELRTRPVPTTTAGAPVVGRSDWGLAALLGLVAAAVTCTGSWIPSLWGDEAATAMSAQRSWPSLMHEISHVDAVHATYYALMHCWVAIAGASPFALRLPSAIALGLAVVGMVLLVRTAGSARTTAVVVAAATTLLPRMSYQGEEARAYALDAAVATWILLLLTMTLRGQLRARTGWVLVGVLSVVGTYLFLYVGLMVAVTGVVVLATPRARAHLRAWIVTSVVTVVAVAPVLVAGVRQKAQVAFLADRVTTDPYSVFVSVFFGSHVLVAVVGWVLVALAIATAGWQWYRQRASRPTSEGGPSLVLVGAVWGGLPLVVLIAANPVLHEFTARYATFTAPGIALLVGLALDQVRRWQRWAGLVAGVLTVAVVAPTWVGQRTPTAFNDSDWAQIAALVHEHATPGDQVAFDVTVRPSRRELLAYRTYPAAFAGLHQVQVRVPYWDNHTWYDDALTVDEAVAAHAFGNGRLWLLQDAHGGVVDHEGEAALQQDGFRVVQRWRAPDSELVELER